MPGTTRRPCTLLSSIAVAVIALALTGIAAPADASGMPSPSFQAPISYAGHLIVLDVMVNGKGPYKFALDTGASGGARVSQQVAKDLDLPVVGQAEDTISVAPGRLYSNDRGVLVMMTPLGIPQIGGTIAGDSIIIDIDSGSGGFGLMQDFESKLKFVSDPKPIGQAVGAGGTVDVDAGTVDGELAFGDQTLHDPVVSFLPLPGVANLGYRVLSNYAITFDQVDGLIRFVAKPPASAATAQIGG